MKKWLDAENIEYRFHDYRIDGLDQTMLETFEAQLGWEAMVNKRVQLTASSVTSRKRA